MQINVHLFNNLNRRMVLYMGYSTGLGILAINMPRVINININIYIYIMSSLLNLKSNK